MSRYKSNMFAKALESYWKTYCPDPTNKQRKDLHMLLQLHSANIFHMRRTKQLIGTELFHEEQYMDAYEHTKRDGSYPRSKEEFCDPNCPVCQAIFNHIGTEDSSAS